MNLLIVIYLDKGKSYSNNFVIRFKKFETSFLLCRGKRHCKPVNQSKEYPSKSLSKYPKYFN